MLPLSRRSFLAASLCAPALIRGALARTRTLTVASLFGDDKPETLVWYRIRDYIEERLPGRFRFTVVRNAALGGEKEVAEGIRLGSIQASLSTMSALSGWVPEVQILDMPFLFRDAAHLHAVLAGGLGEDLSERLRQENFIVGGFINYGARHLMTKKAIPTPDRLAGMRLRIIQSPLHARLWSAFGATPVGIPIPETYNALANGVVDGMDLTIPAYAGFRLYEVVPFITRTAHIRASGIVYYSASFWKSLSDEERIVFRAASREGAEYFNRLMDEDETTSLGIVTGAGGQCDDPADRALWETIGRTVWPEFAGSVGGMEKIEAIAAMR